MAGPRYNANRESESLIQTYRLRMGLTWKELAVLVDTYYQTLQGMNNGTLAPKYMFGKRRNQWKPVAVALAKAFRLDSPAVLFPRYECLMPTMPHPDEVAEDFISAWTRKNARDWWQLPLDGFPEEVFMLLKPKEELVLRLLFFKDMTLDEVAQIFHVSRERIRQTEAKALRKLRHPSRRRIIYRQTMVV